MSLKLECPKCGQLAFVPDEAIHRRARCTGCHATYAVQEALLSNNRASLREKLTLGLGLGIPAIVFLVFVTYWFGYRDTWEIDHYTEIMDSCKTVHVFVQQGNDAAAEQVYTALNDLVGDRTIINADLVSSIGLARKCYAPTGERLEKLRQEQEALELAEIQRSEALLEAQSQHEKEVKNSSAVYVRKKPPPNTVSIGHTYTVQGDCFGAFEKPDLVKAIELYRTDNLAFQKMMLLGQIVHISGGVEVVVVDVSFTGLVKVRPMGEIYEIWLFREWL